MLTQWPTSIKGLNQKESASDQVHKRIRYVCAVPAAWSTTEHQRYTEITRAAGLPEVELVSEAEAAAVVALTEKKAHGMKVRAKDQRQSHD